MKSKYSLVINILWIFYSKTPYGCFLIALRYIEATSITPSHKRRESIFAPDLEESPLSIGPPKLSSRRSTPDQSLNKLNEFLTYRDVSPVRHKLSVPWDDAHEPTKRRYTSKVKKVFGKSLTLLLLVRAKSYGQQWGVMYKLSAAKQR